MPSFLNYKRNLQNKGKTLGEVRKRQADEIIESTWWGDSAARVGYLYDYYHDLESPERLKLRDLHPINDFNKIPIDIKYLRHTGQTYSKDIITYHLQLKPSQKCNVPYYHEVFDVYNAIFPVGLYIDIEDNKGQFNKWLVIGLADFYDAQFPTYEILPCDYVFQWVKDRKKYQMSGCLRSQNSYNSYCCLIWEHISENWVKSVEIFIRKYRGKYIDCERLYMTVERRTE